MAAPERLIEEVRARVLPERPDPDAQAVARAVAELGGPDVLGVVFFGSRKTQAGPDPWSAYDFFVLTRDYRGFYRALKDRGALHRSAALVAALNALLPPNQVSITIRSEAGVVRRAKCAVISLGRFLSETSPRREDHFCLGRLFQPSEVLYAGDEAARESMVRALASAHALTFTWVRPWLPPRFDADTYSRTLLRVSLRGEIRPEPEGRADALWDAQKDHHRAVFGVLLGELARSGELVENAVGGYSLARPASAGERLGAEAYFGWSKVRATARWAKYMVTFDDWLEYILHKAERHTGQPIALTARERRLPIVFLWPRLIRYLRQKDR